MTKHSSNLWASGSIWKPSSKSVLDIWRFKLDQINDTDRLLLDTQEIERANRFVLPNKSRQFVCARSNLRRILSRYLNEDPRQIVFRYGNHGKPSVADNLDLQMNLSHSGDLGVLVVWANGEVGIDIEFRDSQRDFVALANFAFSLREREEFQHISPTLRETVFYQTWTRKEAYLKAIGTGLSISSRSFSVTMQPEIRATIVESTYRGDETDQWSLLDIPINGDYAAALCYWGTSNGLRLWNQN